MASDASRSIRVERRRGSPPGGKNSQQEPCLMPVGCRDRRGRVRCQRYRAAATMWA